jgi:cytidine deaminase
MNALVDAARAAAANAHAPYSGFPVGAALRCADGRVFTGVNVENASYGLTLCAERAALVAAVSAGARTFTALALAARGAPAPCGACRQVLAEFCAPDMPVYAADLNSGGTTRTLILGALLPDVFRLKR